MRPVTLSTERLTIRPISTADLATAHVYASDEELTKYMINLPNRTEAQTLDFLRFCEEQWDSDEPFDLEFAVMLGSEHIGAINLFYENGLAHIGWVLRREYHSNGYCTEAARAIVGLAKKLGYTRVCAICDTRNDGSRRVMERLGMTRAGEQKRVYPDSRGEAREYIYQMII